MFQKKKKIDLNARELYLTLKYDWKACTTGGSRHNKTGTPTTL